MDGIYVGFQCFFVTCFKFTFLTIDMPMPRQISLPCKFPSTATNCAVEGGNSVDIFHVGFQWYSAISFKFAFVTIEFYIFMHSLLMSVYIAGMRKFTFTAINMKHFTLLWKIWIWNKRLTLSNTSDEKILFMVLRLNCWPKLNNESLLAADVLWQISSVH